MNTLFVLALLAAAPLKVTVPEWKYVGIEAASGQVFQARFVSFLSAQGSLEVVTAADMAQVLGLERQRQLLGCANESTNCVAELAGAMGSDAVVSGTISKTGTSFIIDVRAINATNGQPLAVASTRVESEDKLFAWIEAEAVGFSRTLKVGWESSVSAKNRQDYAYKAWPVAIMGIGAAAGALGAVGFGISRDTLAKLRAPGTLPDQRTLIEQGQTMQDGGMTLMISGGVLLAGGIITLLLTREALPRIALLVSGTGAAITFGGAW